MSSISTERLARSESRWSYSFACAWPLGGPPRPNWPVIPVMEIQTCLSPRLRQAGAYHMSRTVCLWARTLGYPTEGGHLWVYLNWALGAIACGCEVIWLEAFSAAQRSEVI